MEPDSTDDNARATLNFYGKNTSTPVATFYVKNADLDDDDKLSQIVYDPGVDGLSAGEIFKGWSVSSKGTTDGLNYTSSTKGKDIEAIRAFLKELTIQEGDVYNIYAMIFKAYSIQFLDEDNKVIHGETLINKSGEAVEYKISTDYTPKTEDQKFEGWYTTSPGIVPVKEKYQVGETVSISDNVIFSPNAPNGNWLVFDSNLGTDKDNKASYTPPQFIKDGQAGTEPTAPTRVGYTFGGWYTEAACTTPFNFSTVISKRTTVYAKWTEVSTAKYTVIIWKQRATDDKNAEDEDKTYDVWDVVTLTGNTNSTINTVVQNGNYVNTGRTPTRTRNISVNGTEYAATGFHCARYDTGKTVKANGTTVVNVYYDRNLITLTFSSPSSGTYRNYYFDVGSGRVRSATMTGLYDAEIDFEWPSVAYSNTTTTTATNIMWNHGSNVSSGQLTFYGSYMLSAPAEVSENLTIAGAGNNKVYFYKQNIDGTWPGENEASNENPVSGYGTSFTLRNKYSGFELYKYKSGTFVQADNDQWSNATVNESVSFSNGRLNIRFERKKYPIHFLDGKYFNGDGVTLKEATKQPLHTSAEIYYQASTASYNKGGADYYEPTAPAGYVFSGWFIDESCTVPYTFSTMPEGGITVYAKWVSVQYRIFLHANADNDPSLDWGGQEMCFRVDEDEKLADGNKIIGKRTEYELVGWYFEDSFENPFNFDAYAINGELEYLADYDQTEPTELDRWSNPTSSENKDKTNNRVWITKKLDLYAKWRSTMKDSRGIQVIYDAGAGTNSANSEPEFTDPLYYLDTAKAIAQPAATPTDDTLHFVGWIVQKWNGSGWVDTSVKVSPGDSFEVLKANAYKEQNPEWDGVTEDMEYFYTIRVVAEYGPKDTPTPTHITWYANGGKYENKIDGEKIVNGDVTLTNIKLQINESIAIPAAGTFTNTGYKFLGWARLDEPAGAFDSENNTVYENEYSVVEEPTLWLKLNEDGKTYSELDADGNVVEGKASIEYVAADEALPYHALYAVWEHKGVFYVFHSSDATVDMIDMGTLDSETYDITAAVKENHLYGGYFKKYLNVTDAQAVAAAKAKTPVDIETYNGSALYKRDSNNKIVRYWTKGDAYTEDGGAIKLPKEIPPETDIVYYLREIPQDFLGLRVQVIYDTDKENAIDNLYLITTVDNNIYNQAGFKVETDRKATFYASYSIQSRHSDEVTTIKAAELNDIGGYIGVWEGTKILLTDADENSQFTVKPYWITLDGVRVDDTRDPRTFNIGNKKFGVDGGMSEVKGE